MALETRIPTPSTTKSVQSGKELSTSPLKGRTLVLFYVLLFSLNLVRVCVVIPWAAHLGDALATISSVFSKHFRDVSFSQRESDVNSSSGKEAPRIMEEVKLSSTYQREQYDHSQNAYSMRLHHDSPHHAAD